LSWAEDAIHRRLAALPTADVRGTRGHDAAVLAPSRGRPVLCVDQTVEGVHFRRDADPRLVGRKAAARALSDLAATAARPRAILLALSAPRARSSKWIEGVLAGARSMARSVGADLVGGDLSAAHGPAGLTVAAYGELDGDPTGRDRARPGEILVITGAVGGSSKGRHLEFRPRLAEGQALRRAGATAMMDTTDGLAWDLFRLARASRVRLELDLAAVPVHRDARSLEDALRDGEDYELVATLPPSVVARARRKITSLRAIGRVRAGSGLWLVDASGRSRRWRRSEGGYEHGR
jgi:thiamine-monophosphate kinase